MSKLNIYVYSEVGQTVSKFGKTKDGEKVVFHNRDTAAQLTIQTDQPALCENNGSNAPNPFTVDPGQKQSYKICDSFDGEFKYTAVIAGSNVEDPIIIVEPRSMYSIDFMTAVVVGGTALLVGVVLTALVMRRRYRRDTPRPAA
jgi:hypothetical protein